ncbi:MAG: metal-dependent transcriptional regulator [Planctomycetota bacterium]
MTAEQPALSSSQEDYLETISDLSDELEVVRISDIAGRLGVKAPPVTRAVQELCRQGLLIHVVRREVRLTERGRKLALALSHRHHDIVTLLTDVLGVDDETAEADACKIEHGLSPTSAQRLHEFLEHISRLDGTTRKRLRARRTRSVFDDLPEGQAESRGSGWRA